MFSPTPAFTRREFIGRGMLLASAAYAAPAFLQSTAHAMTRALLPGLSSQPGVPEDRVLVVIQLSGGNDGLNTVVPFGMPEYARARPGIAINEQQALKLSSRGAAADVGIGLHPQMGDMKALYDEGLCSIVQGVGYPNPNRSHFQSMDIWHSADTSGTSNGWLGRFFDSECCGYGKGESGRADGAGGAAVNQGTGFKPISFESAELFRWSGRELHEALRDPYDALNRHAAEGTPSGEGNAAFLTRTALDAQVASDLIRKAVAQSPLVEYPRTDLGRQLSMVGSMIRAGLKTRVYYVTHGGFDTHAGQGGAQGRHGQLLSQFAAAVRAFSSDMKAQGNQDRVMTMAVSEFGRRVGQNASQGTDHGTAAPMFFFGPMVRPGLLGTHPSLRDLDEGDLKFNTDFRAVYAGVLQQWLKADPKQVLEGAYRPFDVVAKG